MALSTIRRTRDRESKCDAQAECLPAHCIEEGEGDQVIVLKPIPAAPVVRLPDFLPQLVLHVDVEAQEPEHARNRTGCRVHSGVSERAI